MKISKVHKLNAEFAGKISDIKLIMSWPKAAVALKTPVSTLKTWANFISPIPMTKAEDINAVYNNHRHTIQQLKKQLEHNQ